MELKWKHFDAVFWQVVQSSQDERTGSVNSSIIPASNVDSLCCGFILGGNKDCFLVYFWVKTPTGVLQSQNVSLMHNTCEYWQVWNPNTQNTTLQHYVDCYAEWVWVWKSSSKALVLYLARTKKNKKNRNVLTPAISKHNTQTKA